MERLKFGEKKYKNYYLFRYNNTLLHLNNRSAGGDHRE